LSDEQIEAAQQFQQARRGAQQVLFRRMVTGLLQYLIDHAPEEDDKAALSKIRVTWDAHAGM